MTTTNSLCDFSIDLRSDTVTRPTSEMRAEMTRAISGDDVFAEDPEINALQEKCAEMFSMEAGPATRFGASLPLGAKLLVGTQTAHL